MTPKKSGLEGRAGLSGGRQNQQRIILPMTANRRAAHAPLVRDTRRSQHNALCEPGLLGHGNVPSEDK